MARFLGSVRGSRGEVTQLGGAAHGITVNANGWERGVRVVGRENPDTGKDEFLVWATSGSGGDGREKLIAIVHHTGDVEHFGEVVAR